MTTLKQLIDKDNQFKDKLRQLLKERGIIEILFFLSELLSELESPSEELELLVDATCKEILHQTIKELIPLEKTFQIK